LKAAAVHAKVSISTVRRRKEALLAAGAEIGPAGWSIPLDALQTVFLAPPATPDGTSPETPVGTSDTPSESKLIEQLRSENAFLRQQVEQQSRTIERQAEAHAVISAQLTKLGELEPSSPSNETQQPMRRRWWQKRA